LGVFLAGLGAFLILFIILATVIYFLPSIIAFARHKKQRVAIFLLNLFLGATFVGWVIALVWSAMKD
jgi:pilus assembly protein TadC